LLAAALVIYGHGRALGGTAGPLDLFVWLGWGTYSGSIAVDLFFVTSGFLVTGSYLRRRDPLRFLWARTLRIAPALYACVVLSAMVLGAACTHLPLGEYLVARGTRRYVLDNLQVGWRVAYTLPGVFGDNPFPDAVNGSIWTLMLEVRLYVGLAVLGALGLLRRRWLCNVVLLGILALGMAAPERFLFAPHPDSPRLGALFVLGALCFVNRASVPLHGAVTAALVGATWWLRDTPVYWHCFSLAEVAFVLWFAYQTPGTWFERRADCSYGLYLWGFPMQQAVAHVAPTIGPLANSALGLMLALPLGIASWHWVEKPMLAFKTVAWPRRPAPAPVAGETPEVDQLAS
jgi:peptidoglycan/LPS O-acetylase OafA/YrhL